MTTERRNLLRVPISARAREARTAGYVPPDITSNKEQLYIALSVLTDDLVQKVLDSRDSRPPLGLAEKFSVLNNLFGNPSESDLSQAEDPFARLGEMVRHTFIVHVEKDLDRDEDSIPDHLDITKRNLYINAVEGLIARDDEPSPYEFIRRGVNTATAFMCGTLRAIKQLTPDMSAEERLVIARNSYPTLKYLASKSLIEIRQYFDAFEEGDIDGRSDILRSEFVELMQTPLGPRLTIKRPEKQHLPPILMGDMRELDHRIGCPASINLASESAMKKLYSWLLEIVDKAGLFDSVQRETSSSKD